MFQFSVFLFLEDLVLFLFYLVPILKDSFIIGFHGFIHNKDSCVIFCLIILASEISVILFPLPVLWLLLIVSSLLVVFYCELPIDLE